VSSNQLAKGHTAQPAQGALAELNICRALDIRLEQPVIGAEDLLQADKGFMQVGLIQLDIDRDIDGNGNGGVNRHGQLQVNRQLGAGRQGDIGRAVDGHPTGCETDLGTVDARGLGQGDDGVLADGQGEVNGDIIRDGNVGLDMGLVHQDKVRVQATDQAIPNHTLQDEEFLAEAQQHDDQDDVDNKR